MNGKTLVAINFSSHDGEYPPEASRELDAQMEFIKTIGNDSAVLYATNLRRQRPCNACFRTAGALHESFQSSETWRCEHVVSAGKSTALFWNTRVFEEGIGVEAYSGHHFEGHTPIERCAYRVLRCGNDHGIKFILVAYHGPTRKSQGIEKKDRMQYLLRDFKRLSTELGNLPVIFGGDFNLSFVDVQQCFEEIIGADYEYNGPGDADDVNGNGDATLGPAYGRFWMMWHVNAPPPLGLVNPFIFDDRQSVRFWDAPCKLRQCPSRVEFGGEAVANPSINGKSRLHKAAEYGDADMVNLLFAKGLADANAKDDDLATPLHYAAGGGHDETVLSLVENGADTEARDNNGSTALHYAASNGHCILPVTAIAFFPRKMGGGAASSSHSEVNIIAERLPETLLQRDSEEMGEPALSACLLGLGGPISHLSAKQSSLRLCKHLNGCQVHLYHFLYVYMIQTALEWRQNGCELICAIAYWLTGHDH